MPEPTPSPPLLVRHHWNLARALACVGVSAAVVGALALGHDGIAVSLIVLNFLVALF